MAYYDHIAQQWHKATGYKGGAFKELVLNDVLLSKLPHIRNRSILELGAGNGYFLSLVLRRFSGQVPAAAVITDQSTRLLGMAKRHFRIPHATYQSLDVRQPFPFDDGSFDVILALMVFNEVSSRGMRKGLAECYRALARDGLLLIAVIHPDFVNSLRKRGLLGRTKSGVLTMPGAGSLMLPVVTRSSEAYRRMLGESGFQFGDDPGLGDLGWQRSLRKPAGANRGDLRLAGDLRRLAKLRDRGPRRRRPSPHHLGLALPVHHRPLPQRPRHLADAEADLRRAVRLDPSSARAHYNLGSTCEEMLQTDDAKANYQLAFAAGDVRAANNLGRLLLLEARPDHAVQVLLRAQDQVRERPADIAIVTRYHVLKNLGWARLEQERFDEALGHLAAAVELLANEAAAHCLLGRLHGVRGETELATSEWEACLKADPRKIEQDRWRGKAKAFLARRDAAEGS